MHEKDRRGKEEQIDQKGEGMRGRGEGEEVGCVQCNILHQICTHMDSL